MTHKLIPEQTAPQLSVATVKGETWTLTEQNPPNYTMIVFYRGLHCPICKSYLADLEDKLGQFKNLGVEAIAISGDNLEKAQQAKMEWGLDNLKVGYGQTLDSMREWGLYISKAAFDYEPEIFAEPGLFLVKPYNTLYYAALNNAPFARPRFDDLLGGLEFILSKNYPTRGTA
ncbi:MAG: alkyl hydroperoxide reductase [Cyanobacteria bacterium SW_9_44_58]|nr:MAG: alkyl hydroperoxide reductase [Cyanobacteria bacterium SW_9_44_58]